VEKKKIRGGPGEESEACREKKNTKKGKKNGKMQSGPPLTWEENGKTHWEAVWPRENRGVGTKTVGRIRMAKKKSTQRRKSKGGLINSIQHNLQQNLR